MPTTTTLNYCILCGNEKTASTDRIGTDCRALLRGPLALPWAYYQVCESRYSRCCGGLSTDKDHLYFHGKGFECSYGEAPNSVSVEMGVEFTLAGAQTYYIYDDDSTSEGQSYGDLIPYTTLADEAFWTALDKQLDAAAEAAWNNDILTCEHCGNHYYGPNGPCCDGENDEENN